MSVTLGDLKESLLRFAWERRDWPRADVQREFGELVLSLIQQADRLGIDLVAAGEAQVSGRAANVPTLVPSRRDRDA